MASFAEPSGGPPKHEMQYFRQLLSAHPSSSAPFRRVLWTGLYSQMVLMNVPEGGCIGNEKHAVDQLLTFTSGQGLGIVAGKRQQVSAGDVVIIPAGTQHQFINTGPMPLILYTVYSPAEHQATTIHQTKEEGDRLEEEGADEPPEWSQKSRRENEKEGLVST